MTRNEKFRLVVGLANGDVLLDAEPSDPKTSALQRISLALPPWYARTIAARLVAMADLIEKEKKP